MIIGNSAWTFKNELCSNLQGYDREQAAKSEIIKSTVLAIFNAANMIASYTKSSVLVPDAMGGVRVYVDTDGKIRDIGWPEYAAEKAPESPAEKYFDHIHVIEVRIQPRAFPMDFPSMVKDAEFMLDALGQSIIDCLSERRPPIIEKIEI